MKLYDTGIAVAFVFRLLFAPVKASTTIHESKGPMKKQPAIRTFTISAPPDVIEFTRHLQATGRKVSHATVAIIQKSTEYKKWLASR